MKHILLFLCFCFICTAENLKGPYSVQGKLKKTEDPSLLRVQLQGNQGTFTAIPRIDGSFVIRDVPPGAFLLDVLSVKYNFTTVRVDISSKHNGKVKARMLHDATNFIKYPLELSPAYLHQFVLQRKPYDFSGMIRNLLFMGGLCGGVILLFKKFDPSTMKESIRQIQELQDEAKEDLTGAKREKKEK